MLARLVEKSLVAVEYGDAPRSLPPARDGAHLRARHGSTTPARRRHWRSATRAGRSRSPSGNAIRRGSSAKPRTSARHSTPSSRAIRAKRSVSASHSRPFWLRRIELEEAKRRFAQSLEAAPERTALRAQALLAAAAIDFRSGTLAHGMPLAEESHAVAVEIGDKRAQWRALQFVGEFGVAKDEAEVAVPWLERALALARARGLRSRGGARRPLARRRRVDARRPCGRRPLAGREHRGLPRARGVARTRSRRRSTSPRSAAAGPTPARPASSSSRTRCSRFVEISCDAAVGYALANQAGVARARGDFARAHALLDESAARFEAADDDAGLATVLVRRAYLWLVEGRPGRRPRAARGSARAAVAAARPPRSRSRARRPRPDRDDGRRLRRCRAISAEARDIFRRAGDRWGLASTLWRTADLALARGSLDDAEAALHEAHAVLRETQRERWIANTFVGPRRGRLPPRRRRAGVGAARRRPRPLRRCATTCSVSPTVDERLAQLQSGR